MKASDILSVSDLQTDVVSVPEWNCELHIRELSLDAGIKLFQMAKNIGDDMVLSANDIASVIVWGVIDPATGDQVFTDDDIPGLIKKNRNALMTLYSAITGLSGKDAEKN